MVFFVVRFIMVGVWLKFCYAGYHGTIGYHYELMMDGYADGILGFVLLVPTLTAPCGDCWFCVNLDTVIQGMQQKDRESGRYNS